MNKVANHSSEPQTETGFPVYRMFPYDVTGRVAASVFVVYGRRTQVLTYTMSKKRIFSITRVQNWSFSVQLWDVRGAQWIAVPPLDRRPRQEKPLPFCHNIMMQQLPHNYPYSMNGDNSDLKWQSGQLWRLQDRMEVTSIVTVSEQGSEYKKHGWIV